MGFDYHYVVAARKLCISLEEYTTKKQAGLSWCNMCRSWLANDEFGVTVRRGKEARQSRCRGCMVKYSRKLREDKNISQGTTKEDNYRAGGCKIAASALGISLNEYMEKRNSGLLHCSGCKVWLDKYKFSESRKASTGRKSYCVDCDRKNKKEFFQKNKEKYRFKRYNITPEEFKRRLCEQNHRCPICCRLDYRCKLPNTKNKYGLVVDHDPSTGINNIPVKVRALLCSECNLLLGIFEENIDLIRSAKEYLVKNGF
jgi:hypothetical protein